MPNLASLNRVLRKLKENNLPHYAWADPDHPEWGMTSIATAPLVGEERAPMKDYRLYAPVVYTSACRPLKPEDSLTPGGSAMPGTAVDIAATAQS